MIVAGSCARERKELRIALELEGHEVSEAESANLTLEQTRSGSYDALIVNSGFTGIEPYELCREIRRISNLGIIVLTGQDNARQDRIDIKQDRIDALNAGADDHLSSPFVLRELLARVRAVLRRVTQPAEERRQLVLHDRTVDLKAYKVRGPGSRVSHLTPKEFLVLACLIAHADKPFTHQSLAQTVWQRDGLGEVEFVRVVIKQLRRKLESDPDNPRYILTERSVGYRFRIPGPPATSNFSELVSLAG